MSDNGNTIMIMINKLFNPDLPIIVCSVAFLHLIRSKSYGRQRNTIHTQG